ncbi:hypothetical protein FE257_005838 [Aspergillus nanangensis]|uniref:Uncharacterized protein n=1 Tax=Aspergillus nanangensis TaxID=2582783 RepID=A0AAD4CRF8_ASPNN|nr:hypothetical protein FE257_005838 [Aspergillus nanangensis]
MASVLDTPLIVWKHPYPAATPIEAFRRYVNKAHGLSLQTYRDLHQWTVSETEQFAAAAWTFCGIKYSAPPTCVATGLNTMWPPPAWFPGARLNYTENLLSLGLAARPDGIAVTIEREGRQEVTRHTFRDLEQQVAVWATALRSLGVTVGDRVATVLTNSIDALVILLAAGSIGAIFSSTSPDMGAHNIVDRYSQVKPKVFICETTVQYSGKKLGLYSKLQAANARLEELVPDLTATIVVSGPLFRGKNVKFAADILPSSNGQRLVPRYEQLPFDHPIYILYSSGTTGKPKCLCHAAGRALLQQKKELMLHQGLDLNFVMYQYTTTGWMMWNYQIAGLSLGAHLVLYDGSPLYPTPVAQLELVQRNHPKYLGALKQHGVPRELDLSSLQVVSSSGSPLSREMYHWFYDTFPGNVALFSGSGGTDLVGGIVQGTTMSPVHAGEIAVPGLGMKVEIFDQDGHDISQTGEKGDLVITKPFFSMPLTFWGPDGEEKYHKAYFAAFPGVWYHGDFIQMNPATGGYHILGRSDGVLNPGGIRFGTAELYGVLDRLPEIQDYIAVGHKTPERNEERVILFIKMMQGDLSHDVLAAIKSTIRQNLSPHHVPGVIVQVKDIPYTLNGKRMENLVRDIVAGATPNVSGTVANPECLEEYRRWAYPKAKI